MDKGLYSVEFSGIAWLPLGSREVGGGGGEGGVSLPNTGKNGCIVVLQNSRMLIQQWCDEGMDSLSPPLSEPLSANFSVSLTRIDNTRPYSSNRCGHLERWRHL